MWSFSVKLLYCSNPYKTLEVARPPREPTPKGEIVRTSLFSLNVSTRTI